MRSSSQQTASTFADTTAAAGLSGTLTTAAPDSVAMITRDAFVVIEVAEVECDAEPAEGEDPTAPGAEQHQVERPVTYVR
jgi:hypothetical protein